MYDHNKRGGTYSSLTLEDDIVFFRQIEELLNTATTVEIWCAISSNKYVNRRGVQYYCYYYDYYYYYY
jgi:hypothetical protein